MQANCLPVIVKGETEVVAALGRSEPQMVRELIEAKKQSEREGLPFDGVLFVEQRLQKHLPLPQGDTHEQLEPVPANPR